MSEDHSSQGTQVEEQDQWLVSCRCCSAKSISTLLSCLNHQELGPARAGDRSNESNLRNGRVNSNTRRARTHSPQLVTIFCNPNCVTFHVHGKSKQFQASVDIPAKWFSDYRLAEVLPLSNEDKERNEGWQAQPGGEFCVNLSSFLECLHVLGTTQSMDRTQVCLSYNFSHEYLKMELFLEDCGIISTSTVPGMAMEEDQENRITSHGLHLAFRSSQTLSRMIVQSEILQQVVPELESVIGATEGTVALSNKRGLEIATVGHLGECLVSIPATGTHIVMLDIQEADTKPMHTFPLHSLMASFRGLEIAQETCITMNADGMMAIQHQIILESCDSSNLADEGNGTPCFVEFILCALQEDDDNEQESNKRLYTPSNDTHPLNRRQDQNSSSNDISLGNKSVVSCVRDTQVSSRKQHSPSTLINGDHKQEEETDFDEKSTLPPASTNSLFQSLVDKSMSTSSGDDDKRQRLGKRNLRREERKTCRRRRESDKDDGDESENSDSSSDAISRSLLESDEDSQNKRKDTGLELETRGCQENQEELELSQPLDVTAPASTRLSSRGRLDDYDDDDATYSSGEIVYGPQD